MENINKETKKSNKYQKFLIPAMSLVLVGGISYFAINNVYAEDSNLSPVMQRVVSRFNLNSDEVETVLNEYRNERQEERKTQMEEKLSNLVSEGKLTESQKSELLNLMSKRQEENESNSQLTKEERKQKMDEHRQEMQTWAQNNNIDLTSLDLGFGPRGNFGDKGEGQGQGYRRNLE